MALTGGDALTAFSFEFSVDGTTIPNVVAVNSISKNAPVIETKSMTPASRLPGEFAKPEQRLLRAHQHRDQPRLAS